MGMVRSESILERERNSGNVPRLAKTKRVIGGDVDSTVQEFSQATNNEGKKSTITPLSGHLTPPLAPLFYRIEGNFLKVLLLAFDWWHD